MVGPLKSAAVVFQLPLLLKTDRYGTVRHSPPQRFVSDSEGVFSGMEGVRLRKGACVCVYKALFGSVCLHLCVCVCVNVFVRTQRACVQGLPL